MSGAAVPTNNAIRTACYLIARSGDLTGQRLCNLKLQKLVYYAQGFALAIRDQPLFSEPLEAWDNGPVVRDVYRLFHDGRSPIEPDPDFDVEAYLPENRELLDAILATYGHLSPLRLSGMTHSEPPWIEAYNKRRNMPLAGSTMKSFFSDLVETSRQGQSINGRPIFPVGSLQHQHRRELSSRMDRHREKLREIASRPREETNPWAEDED